MSCFKKTSLVSISSLLLMFATTGCVKDQSLVPTENTEALFSKKKTDELMANVPKYGTGWIQKSYTYTLHKPYNLDTNARHSYNSTWEEHTFWIQNNDEPFQSGSNTSPRSEMRFKHTSVTGTDNYTTGNHQFEADIKVYSASNHPIIMQVFGSSADNNKPAFNIKAFPDNGGELRFFDGTVLVSGIYDTWVHVNVVHATAERKFHVFINGVEVPNGNGKFYFEDKGAAQHYFKCGVYTSIAALSKVKLKHIRYYYKP
ncbi:polysaccharide lyase family 7 protein [Pedobacter mucosus]|uniref:polysaccharide lyase family 7 protein n=1 Tax=Pedobacter mucosus TaxID=2895286 RepID=UPI001EE4D5EB|nr:polysaccharide lyase family 7 protein [Pedobacter mucosus]UKT64935.1 polysaccharide lyase family 7 protein [Pedobacter mucosus]